MRTSRYLWIKNLPPKVTEEDIRESLISHGKIHNVKIHEVADGKGAVVAFFDQTGATKAIEASNKLDGVSLKIEYCDLNGSPGLQRLHQEQQQQQQQQLNSDKTPDWADERGNRAKSPLESHRNRSRSSSLSSTRSGRSNLTDVSKHGSSSRRERNYHKATVDHVRRKVDKSDRERDHDENSQESGGESLSPRFGEMRGLKVSQLPQRSSDSNIKEGLFHDLKRFGKITSVEVKGEDPSNRCAIVTFKRAEDAEKAYMKWNDKVYFFTNVIVERHPGTDTEDPSFCQPEQVLNEFHPKSTKTLFVGNLHHDPDSPKAKAELLETFEEFGSILEVDIKKQPNQPGVAYAFIQYADINSVVRALHKAESIKIAGKPVKLGFGKSQPTACLWLSNLPSGTTDGFLANHFKRYGPVKYITLHPQQLRALVHFETVDSAQNALSEQKNRIIAGRKLQADYASARCQRHLLDQICQLTTYHRSLSHPLADALRMAYSHAYMKTSYYHHYIRNFARYGESRSRSRHIEDMELYDPYAAEIGRRSSGSNDYESYSARRSGGSVIVGGSGSNYPESGASAFGMDSGNSRNSICGSSGSVKKCSERNSVNKTNGPSSESHYSRNRSDSPFSSKSSHSRDLRSRSRSPRIDRKHRDSSNRSHNRSDSSHSGEGEASADSSRQRVMRRRRSTTRGSHSLSAGVGSDTISTTRSSGQSSSTCLRREHRGPSSASARTSRIQRLKSEVKPAASTSATSGRTPTRRSGNASDDEGESDVEAPGIASVTGPNVTALPSGHSGTGDSSSIHSGGSGGHRSDDATDIGELMAQREKLLREIIEMDDASGSHASTMSSSSARTVASENHRSKPILREVVDSSHHDKLKPSQELNLPSDTRKLKEKAVDEEPGVNRTTSGNDEDHECKDFVAKRKQTDSGVPSRLSNGPSSKSVPVTMPPLSAGLLSEAVRSPSQSKADSDGSFKLLTSKVEESGAAHEVRAPSSGLPSTANQFHKVHPVTQPFDGKSLPSQRILQHSVKPDQCASAVNDSVSFNSERKLTTSTVTTCVNASRDPRLAPQQYGSRLVGGNIPQHSKAASSISSSADNSSHHETSTERLTDLLQRFVQPVTAMAPTIAGHIEKVNPSRLSASSDACSPPPPPPPLPHHQSRGLGSAVIDPHQHSLPKGPTSEKQSHDDSSTLADCEDPELKSVMQKTSTIDKQIEELDMKISRSEIARATVPTIDLSKYRIRPRSDSSKPPPTTARLTVVNTTPTVDSSGPSYSSSTIANDKPSPWKEEGLNSNPCELNEQASSSTTSASLKSRDTSEFVKSMLMQSSRNSSFFMGNSASTSVANTNSTVTCTSSMANATTASSPPISASTTAVSSSWTSSPSCDDSHRPVSASSTSVSVVNRLSSPPIVVSALGQSNVTNVTYLNRSQLTSNTSSVTSHPTSCSVSSSGTGPVTSCPVSVPVNSTSCNRPSRLPSCSVDVNSDTHVTPSTSHESTNREPRSPENLKSILKKEQIPETKSAAMRSSPTITKSSFTEASTVAVKPSLSTTMPVVATSSSQKIQRSPTSVAPKLPIVGNTEIKPSTTVSIKRKHSSDDIKKACKFLKVENESDSNLFRPDSFLFANKSDVKKEKRSVEQVKRVGLITTEIITEVKPNSPVTEMKSSPQLSNSSHDETKSKKDDIEEKQKDRKLIVEDPLVKKRKPKDKSVESSDSGSKVDDSDDESKQESKRKRKKKVNRMKDDYQRLEKKEKKKKKKKLEQNNQILKKKTREKLKETEDKLKKLKQRKQRSADGKDCDLSDSIEKTQKKEKHKEKADRKCSNDESNSEEDWKKAGIYLSMYDLVKTKRKAEAAKNPSHSKEHKRDGKTARRKSTENLKKSVFDSPDNSIDESESRASSGKSVTRKPKGKTSKSKRRRTLLHSNFTSDDSDEREDNSLLNKLGASSKPSNRFRLNSDEADDETDFEELRKSAGKSGKKKPEKRKAIDSLNVSVSKKMKKPKVSGDVKKKKAYTDDSTGVKKRRKKNSNKLDTADSGKQKMSVASVFSDVDTDSSTGTDYRMRYDVKVRANEESDESQVSEDGLPILSTPKSRLPRQRTAASSPTTPSTEPMSDDAVMTDLTLSGLTPFPEKNKNPLKEALCSAHEESRKELKELQRDSGILSERHRAIADDEDVEVSEDLPSLEVMTRPLLGIDKSPSSIDDEPPAITCNDAPTLTTDAEADDVGSLVEETVIEEHCVDPIVDDVSEKCQSSVGDSCASILTSRTSSSVDEQVENVDLISSFNKSPEPQNDTPIEIETTNRSSDDSLMTSSFEISSNDFQKTVTEKEPAILVKSVHSADIPVEIKEPALKTETAIEDSHSESVDETRGNSDTSSWLTKRSHLFSSNLPGAFETKLETSINQQSNNDPAFSITSAKPLATVFPVEQTTKLTTSDLPVLELPTKSQGPPDIVKSDDDHSDSVKSSNETGNKVEMVRYVQRIMERVSVDICEDNKGPGKRIKKGSSGLSCSPGSSHPNQNILSSIADRGLSDRKPITTTNPACLLPPGCNIYLEDSKMLPNLPASVTLTAPMINPSCPPSSLTGQTPQNAPPVTVIPSCALKGVAPLSVNTTMSRGPPQPSTSINSSIISSLPVPNFSSSSSDSGRICTPVSQETVAQSQIINQSTSGSTPVTNSSTDTPTPKPAASQSNIDSHGSSNYSTRRMFSRRKRNSSSNANSKPGDNDREGSWHAHVDEVLEKVVHGKSNVDGAKSLQPGHLSVKNEDQLMQQKETDEAVRAIERSMIRGGSSDVCDGNTNELSSKQDVDPYEPNFDEPSPSEINRNILTHSHHKRQDGINVPLNSNESEEHRAPSTSSRPVFEALLAELPEKNSQIQPQLASPKVAPISDLQTTEIDSKTAVKQTAQRKLDVSENHDESSNEQKLCEDSSFTVEKNSKESMKEKQIDEVSEHVSVKKDPALTGGITETEIVSVNIKTDVIESKEVKIPLVIALEDTAVKDEQKVTAPKDELKSDDESLSHKTYEQVDRQKLEAHHQTPPQSKTQLPSLQQSISQVQQLHLAQFNLQKQISQAQPQSHQNITQLPSQQLPQSIFIQQQTTPSQQQTQQLQLQQLTQQAMKFPHLLQQKPVTGVKSVEAVDAYRLVPSSKDTVSNVEATLISDSSLMTKESVTSVTSASGSNSTRKRANRAMSQTALSHVEEILDAVAHNKNFDLTQYAKDTGRRRSNSGEDHFPQPNSAVPPVLKDGSGLFTTDLRVLTPRSANAMVSSKVGAEEQAQIQATLAQPQQASGPSVSSKVNLTPLVLGQFLKHNATLQNQQFQQTRPASAVGVNDATNMNSAPLIAAVEPVFQKLALATTSFASLPPGASISPALASTGLNNKTLAAVPLQPIETAKIVHPGSASGGARHASAMPQPSVTPTTQVCVSTPQSCSQPFAVAQATATVEDRGHAIERIPNPGLAAVQHHRDQISPRLPSVSSASPGTTTVSIDSKSSSVTNSNLLNPVTGIVSSVGNRPSSNPVHLQGSNLSDSVQSSHQGRNFLQSAMGFDHSYEFQMQMQAAMQQLMRQNAPPFNSDGNLLDLLSMHYHLNSMSPSNSSAPHQFWPNSEQRREGHPGPANAIITGVPVQIPPTIAAKQPIGTAPEWSPDQLHMLQSKYHMSWKGKLALKNDEVMVQMLFITGNLVLVNNCIQMLSGSLGGGSVPPLQQALKIVQRMRMEQSQLEGVVRKMEEDHCMLLAVPSGEEFGELETQANILSSSFIKYLQEKAAAGIINVNHAESQQPAYVVHIFPPGEFSRQRLSSCPSEVINACGELPHLLVIITTV